MPASGQADFGAGIYRGRETPGNAAYDLLNVLIDDEGQPFRRGGSVYKSTSDAGTTLTSIGAFPLQPGNRVLAWNATNLYVLDGSDAPVSIILTSDYMRPASLARMVGAGRFVFWHGYTPDSSGDYHLGIYAGSRKAQYSTGTVTTTAGSRTVTGSGTTWSTNVDPGMILNVAALYGVVESVNSNTSITLRDPAKSSNGPGASYTLRPFFTSSFFVKELPACLSEASGRLLVGYGNRVAFSDGSDTPWIFGNDGTNLTAYHEMPTAATVIGLEGIGGAAYVFTTRGTYLISNLAFDPIDDVGNIQHTVEQINELVLWGDSGIAKWRGAVLAPCIDDVWLLPGDEAPVPIGAGIKPLYLSYVKAGYQPGMATVHRGHYFLPIVNGTTWVDTLICRLDREFAWTRWSGHAAGLAYAQEIGATTRSPKLFGIPAAGQRVTNLTDAWAPSASNASEADATTHAVKVETRDLPTPSRGKGSRVTRVKVRYEAAAAGAVAVTAAVATGLEGAAYTALSLARDTGGAASDGSDESEWTVVNVRAPAVRFKLESSSALSSFTLRSVSADYVPLG
jgi:hypothetical protein